jgi:hypothetical protein
MRNLHPASFSPSPKPAQIGFGVLLLVCSSTLSGQQTGIIPSASAPEEQQALKVANDSDWAHTVKPTTQDSSCTYQNPAFPGLFPENKGALIDATAPVPDNVVKADGSGYLIRFQSAKPVQAAIRRLLAMGEKWYAYGPEHSVSGSDGPTDLANGFYNVADMITIAVILKYPARDGQSLFDYGFGNDGSMFPSPSFRVWPCAGLRTVNGQVFARLVPSAFGRNGYRALQLLFPRLIDGKPLISNPREEVEFRWVVNRRVFETTFCINPGDVLDGSEKSLYLPAAFTDLYEITQQHEN